MINAILNGLLSFITSFVTVAFLPIDTIITNLVPDVSNILLKVSQFFSLLENYGAFVVSYTGFLPEFIAITVALILYNIYIPLAVHGIKLALRWYRMLMP